MSNFTARRAPNVSQYLANLNTVPSAHELNASAQNDFPLGDDGLDFLTNAEFFDFDNFDNGAVGGIQPMGGQPQQSISPKVPLGQSQYQFGEFQTYQPMPTSGSLPPSPPNGLQGAYTPQMHYPPGAQVNVGDKRKASIAGIASSVDLEDDSRMAAEEDKRRRNTAASARFRVKKKQREQALEKQTKEMSDKMHALESKVQQLETENKWLKELITEKSNGDGVMSEKKGDGEKKAKERSIDSRTDGVGTEEKAEA
ncbi:hypothetical protein LTR36_005112 [Oleoguttula mirabilis]|uniref:BZIP domain-containing protein n=1 Tax=Oleoguttula mirabilis TaxID=1507867 RepID=A0AAV9JW32_9PEZI|nr:hypothetical protein LTR36_005112 [Oleoguttula mirabilis]